MSVATPTIRLRLQPSLAQRPLRINGVHPRRVDFLVNSEDMGVAILGLLGFTTQAIMEKTGLTFGQVNYRLGKARIKRREYRQAASPVASWLVREVHDNPLLATQMSTQTLQQLHRAGVDKSPVAEKAHLNHHTRRNISSVR